MEKIVSSVIQVNIEISCYTCKCVSVREKWEIFDLFYFIMHYGIDNKDDFEYLLYFINLAGSYHLIFANPVFFFFPLFSDQKKMVLCLMMYIFYRYLHMEFMDL